MPPLITLMTDFGQKDGYVAAMKGVILSIAPEVQLVDITHSIAPQDVLEAAFVLASAAPYFPQDAIHLIVVDPGVGSARRALAVKTSQGIYVAPDNGVLAPSLKSEPPAAIISLTNERFWRTLDPSRTFHGRDIFAPVAAHLAGGTPIERMGDEVQTIEGLELPKVIEDANGTMRGKIVHVDHFGNLISNIAESALERNMRVQIRGEEIGQVQQTYAHVAPGEPVALVGSHGYLEIAIRNGNAAERLGARRGSQVTLRKSS